MDHTVIKTRKLKELETIAQLAAHQFLDVARLYSVIGIVLRNADRLPPPVMDQLAPLLNDELNDQESYISRVEMMRDLLVKHRNLIPANKGETQALGVKPSAEVVNIFTKRNIEDPGDN